MRERGGGRRRLSSIGANYDESSVAVLLLLLWAVEEDECVCQPSDSNIHPAHAPARALAGFPVFRSFSASLHSPVVLAGEIFLGQLI